MSELHLTTTDIEAAPAVKFKQLGIYLQSDLAETFKLGGSKPAGVKNTQNTTSLR